MYFQFARLILNDIHSNAVGNPDHGEDRFQHWHQCPLLLRDWIPRAWRYGGVLMLERV